MSDLLQQILDNSSSIETVYQNAPDIPESIWHLLLTDSAERVMHVMKEKNKIIDERLIDVLWVKRRWAVGQATITQLNRSRKALASLEQELARRTRWSAGYWQWEPNKHSFLISRDALKVVEYATRKQLRIHLPLQSPFQVSWDWQLERLCCLCELSQFTDRLLLAYEDNALLPVELVPIALK